jgi:hypothetical protein
LGVNGFTVRYLRKIEPSAACLGRPALHLVEVLLDGVRGARLAVRNRMPSRIFNSRV